MNARALTNTALVFIVLIGFSLSGPAQTISYLIPDIGIPGMNSYVEIIAPHNGGGAFGIDGFYLNNPGDAVRVQCADPSDTLKITIGPIVVSWDGRMISTQIFIHPDQQPPSSYWDSVGPEFEIPLQVFANGTSGNLASFYIVRPQPAIISSLDGQLGSGGVWGLRSKRGAMIVDSVELNGGNYSISNIDQDLSTPGNQALLPAIIISRGPIRTAANTIIQVNGSAKHAGPGGGGGGGNFCDWSGTGTDGGNGFTGGGPGGRNKSGNPFGSDEHRNPGTGSGPFLGATGGSLNGIRGGDAPAFEASGGGTGHPFGTSGIGCSDGSACNPPGGYGGGSGQQQIQNGGAGGYATAGQSSRNGNGGQVHGNDMLVPLAGGSGGASGNPQSAFSCSGDGGGGGGALRLYGRSVDAYLVTAHGGDGSDGASAKGGAGSGGAVSIEGKLPSGLWKLMATGGAGPGTTGGAGRIRMDGPISWFSSGLPVDETMYFGPSTDTTMFVARSFTLTGTGNGEDVTLYLKSDRSPWTPIATLSGYPTNGWSHGISLDGGDGVYFISAVQRVPGSSTDPFASRPAAVMSQASANIIISRTSPHIVAAAQRLLPELRCTDEVLDTMMVYNIGEAALVIPDARFIPGARGFELLEPAVFPVQIAMGDSLRFIVRYRRTPGVRGSVTDTLRVYSNDVNATRNPVLVPYELLVQQAELASSPASIQLPDVLLCEASSADTVIVLSNTGSIPLTISAPVFSDPSLSLLAPPPSVFPLVLMPGTTVTVTLRMTHTASGVRTGTATFSSDPAGCNVSTSITMSGRAGDAELMLDPIPDFPSLLCYGEYADTLVRLRNSGDVSVAISSITSGNNSFQIIGPTTPFILVAGSSIGIQLRFIPATVGDMTATLRVDAQPCSLVLQENMRGRRDSVGASAVTINFGLLHTTSFPAFGTGVIINTGTIPLTIDSISLPAPFSVITSFPAVLQPGDSIQVQLRFDNPGSDGYYSAMATVVFNPFCDSLRFEVIGESGEAALEIVAGLVEGGPGEVVSVPVYLRNVRAPRLFGATSISSVLRFDASLLVPLFQNSGVIVGGERNIPISIPLITDSAGIALSLPFMVTLGTKEATALTIEQSAAVGGALSITETPGAFTLLDVCREGGTRLFDGSVHAGIQSNHPNPFNPMTEILYSTIETTYTELFVVDVLGRKIATLFQGYPPTGLHTAIFNGSDLPSGFYVVLLQTPSSVFHRLMILAK